MVRSSAISFLANIEPWSAEEIDKQAAEVDAALERLPIPLRQPLAECGASRSASDAVD
jgi:hypothetical protein